MLVDPQGNVFTIANTLPPQARDRRRVATDGTWKNRINNWLGDSVPKYRQPITQKNLQEMRSYMAQANGGLFGVFPGNSRETSRLPLAFSDYIFAIIVEDLGFIGGLAIMVLYLWLLARAYYIAARCTQAYPAFLVTGMAVMIAFPGAVSHGDSERCRSCVRTAVAAVFKKAARAYWSHPLHSALCSV